MNDEEEENAAISFSFINSASDLLGLKKGFNTLAKGIVFGVGTYFKPSQRLRDAKAEIEVLEMWEEALRKRGIEPKLGNVKLGDRSAIRVTLENSRHQRNREAIAAEAIEESEDISEPKDIDLSLEWLEQFWREAELIGNADLQRFWGRVLARKTTGQNGFSLQSVDILRKMEPQDARAFERLASMLMTVTLRNDKRQNFLLNGVLDNPYDGNSTQQTNAEFASNFISDEELSRLLGIGLISHGPETTKSLPTKDGRASFKIAGLQVFVHPRGPANDDMFLGTAYDVTMVGREVLALIDSKPSTEYLKFLTRVLENGGHGLEFKEGHKPF